MAATLCATEVVNNGLGTYLFVKFYKKGKVASAMRHASFSTQRLRMANFWSKVKP
ncbi:MAG: hypothetical protein H7A24_13825 [Leptospiraceae bacterium]|nr:hypothetical protein [Leptospiraceae bacterium]